jgi:hypothetical protein
MVLTEASAAAAASATPPTTEGAEERPNRLGRWARRDPVRAVATVLIVASLIWRADIASRGFLTVDDFMLSSRAAMSGLTAAYLQQDFADHLMPGGLLIFWFVVRGVGLQYWPYLLILVAIQGLIAITFFRLLRRLLPSGWGVLVPLSVLLFTPLTLDSTSFFTTGILLLPMQLAMILALGAQVKYVRTRRIRHLVTLGLALVLGLVFIEKALLIVPLVFLFTACLLVTGGPLQSAYRALVRYWPAWLVLGTIGGAYLVPYFGRPGSTYVHAPGSVGEVITFVRLIVGESLVPGLVGGPWHWTDSNDDFAPLVAPDALRVWLAWIVFGVLIVATIRLRPVAKRAWILLGLYVALNCAALGSARLGTMLTELLGLSPRYVSDSVVVAALCIGVACFGLQDPTGLKDPAGEPRSTEDTAAVHLPAPLRQPAPLAIGLLIAVAVVLAVGVGTAQSADGFTRAWSVKHGRDYVATVQAELAAAPPGTVFLDRLVPGNVLGPLSWPDNLQSHFFSAARPRPVFVTGAENPSIIDDAGHIRAVTVEGNRTPPGPAPGCGYRIDSGFTYTVLLDGSRFEWEWAVRIAYLSPRDVTMTFGYGDATHEVPVRRGLHQYIFQIVGEGNAVRLRIEDPNVTVCVDQITVGSLGSR